MKDNKIKRGVKEKRGAEVRFDTYFWTSAGVWAMLTFGLISGLDYIIFGRVNYKENALILLIFFPLGFVLGRLMRRLNL